VYFIGFPRQLVHDDKALAPKLTTGILDFGDDWWRQEVNTVEKSKAVHKTVELAGGLGALGPAQSAR
jgi:hypothetical protein